MAHPFGYVAAETLTGARTITAAEIASTSIFAFDPGGAGRDVTLPAVATSAGQVLFIANTADAAEVLTIKNASAATICTPTQNETAVLFCNGTTWFGLVGANS